MIYKDLGSYYQQKGEPQQAAQRWNIGLNYLKKSEYIFQKFKNKAGLLEVYNGFGDIYRRQDDYKNAEQYTQKVLSLAEEMNDLRFRRNAYKDLSKIYAKKRQFEQAYENERQFNKLRNQLVNEEGNRNMAQAQALFGDQLKEMEAERAEARNALLPYRKFHDFAVTKYVDRQILCSSEKPIQGFVTRKSRNARSGVGC